jgi:cytochrome P450 family 49 subfamily A
VFLQPNVVARSPDYFPDPDTFKPERWLVKDGSYKAFPLMPFGYGARMCAGKRFAEQEIYLGLINVSKH